MLSDKRLIMQRTRSISRKHVDEYMQNEVTEAEILRFNSIDTTDLDTHKIWSTAAQNALLLTPSMRLEQIVSAYNPDN